MYTIIYLTILAAKGRELMRYVAVWFNDDLWSCISCGMFHFNCRIMMMMYGRSTPALLEEFTITTRSWTSHNGRDPKDTSKSELTSCKEGSICQVVQYLMPGLVPSLSLTPTYFLFVTPLGQRSNTQVCSWCTA